MHRLLKTIAATACLAVMAGAAPAFAGECPADQVRAGATAPGPSAPERVTDTVIAAIDLGDGYNLPGRTLRMRRLEIRPGGVVPWHSHETRPANIYVVRGAVTEYRSNCATPILHRQGEVVAEHGAIAHWWKNTGTRTAVLISADIPPPGNPDETGM
jgi:quercetin dioxygenase-like cupin family protein